MSTYMEHVTTCKFTCSLVKLNVVTEHPLLWTLASGTGLVPEQNL